ncbi:MAG: flagellar protein FliS [Lachnospira sp.]|nr:flagellar protein FliS [Lachnospira sp.]
MTDEQIKEYTLRITGANASGLTVIIYELLEDCFAQADKAYQEGQMETFAHTVKKAERYIGELLHGLNYEDIMAKEIAVRYVRAQRTLIAARVEGKQGGLAIARGILEELKPLFERLASADKSAPIISNTQKVYAGLTYGKTSLNEMAIDPVSNRGYSV